MIDWEFEILFQNWTEYGMSGKVAGLKYALDNFLNVDLKKILFLPCVEIVKDVKLFPLIFVYFSMGQYVIWNKCSILDKAIVRDKLL